ncbi:MAG TPA: carboxymuconolactone decarboxylase family protein [Magnetospirillaceae bacterium]|jgi:AhpD family alkylhydroperoxidase
MTLTPRMTNPVMTVPGSLQHLLALGGLLKKVPEKTRGLIHLRASQINGCGYCTDMHARELKQMGETDERLWSVAAWREAPYYTDAERAVLALTEAATRINDRADAVPDEVWDEARKHYDEETLGQIVIDIALINFWNRVSVTTRQVAGAPVRKAAE